MAARKTHVHDDTFRFRNGRKAQPICVYGKQCFLIWTTATTESGRLPRASDRAPEIRRHRNIEASSVYCQSNGAISFRNLRQTIHVWAPGIAADVNRLGACTKTLEISPPFQRGETSSPVDSPQSTSLISATRLHARCTAASARLERTSGY